MNEKNKIEKNALYLVATPIGNLSDISDRARKVLSEVDFIAAEDTRNTVKLLSLLGIKKPLVSYFEHNKRERGEEILARMSDSQSCALVTDAGTPAISDPGEDLVKLCYERGVKVIPIPGACAAVSALAASGLPAGRFTFEGFLTVSKSKRREHLESLKNESRTMIFYEAPHKLRRTLADMIAVFGNRRINLAREITKLNEEFNLTTFEEAIRKYGDCEPLGEFVIVVEGAEVQNEESELLKLTVEEHFAHYIDAGLAKMDAAKAVARDRGCAKSEIYRILNKKM